MSLRPQSVPSTQNRLCPDSKRTDRQAAFRQDHGIPAVAFDCRQYPALRTF